MFRELTRKNKAATRVECIRLLETEKRGVLSVQGDDGYPYGMPMNHFYNVDDGCLYFHCGRAGHRLDALRRNGKVSYCVMDRGVRPEGAWAYDVQSVIVFGQMEIIDDWDVMVDIATRLSRLFPCSEDYIQQEIRQSGKGTLLLKLTPEHICGKLVTEA
jgi:nitroimidazol reductase NimA-like FMN-containing flavoprotein (pyridoxamine 5'-phosphate oxidase superfamily)